jgi:hypothetical protein
MSSALEKILAKLPDGIVKLTAERKNTFHSAGISSGSEALTSHLGV